MYYVALQNVYLSLLYFSKWWSIFLLCYYKDKWRSTLQWRKVTVNCRPVLGACWDIHLELLSTVKNLPIFGVWVISYNIAVKYYVQLAYCWQIEFFKLFLVFEARRTCSYFEILTGDFLMWFKREWLICRPFVYQNSNHVSKIYCFIAW